MVIKMTVVTEVVIMTYFSKKKHLNTLTTDQLSGQLFATLARFFLWSPCLNVFLPPPLIVQCPKCLDFCNAWEKVIKEVVSDWTTFAHKGCKIAAQKKVCFLANFALLAGFVWYWCYYPHRSRDTMSPICGILR